MDRILLDFRHRPTGFFESENGRFLVQTMAHLERQNPGLEFLFLGDSPAGEPGNPQKMIAYLPSRIARFLHSLGMDTALKPILKKLHIRLIIRLDAPSPRLGIPQAVWYRQAEPGKFRPARNAPFLMLETAGPGPDLPFRGEIIPLAPAPDAECRESLAQDRMELKTEITQGRDFFLVAGPVGDPERLLTVLRAFSLFKKRQQSNMCLVWTGVEAKIKRACRQKLGSYKYREAVIFLDPTANLRIGLLGACYALVIPGTRTGALPLLNAFACGAPVILAGPELPSWLDPAAVLATAPGNEQDLGGAMMRLFTDEQLRNRLIETGRAEQKKFGADQPASSLGQGLKRMMETVS